MSEYITVTGVGDTLVKWLRQTLLYQTDRLAVLSHYFSRLGRMECQCLLVWSTYGRSVCSMAVSCSEKQVVKVNSVILILYEAEKLLGFNGALCSLKCLITLSSVLLL